MRIPAAYRFIIGVTVGVVLLDKLKGKTKIYKITSSPKKHIKDIGISFIWITILSLASS